MIDPTKTPSRKRGRGRTGAEVHTADIDAEFAFADLVSAFSRQPAGSLGGDAPTSRGFGSRALTVDGKTFAMLVRGDLVVKLPRPRVDAPVANRRAVRFAANQHREMREWARCSPADHSAWVTRAVEALAFLGRRS